MESKVLLDEDQNDEGIRGESFERSRPEPSRLTGLLFHRARRFYKKNQNTIMRNNIIVVNGFTLSLVTQVSY